MLWMIVACADAAGNDTADVEALGVAREDLARAVWTESTAFEDWEQAAPWTGVQPSSDGTHGAYVQIWVNDAARGSLDAAEAALGSTVVKRAYADAEGADPVAQLTVMHRSDDPSVAVTGWLWMSVDAATGVVTTAEDDGGCAGCHASGSDYRRMVTDRPGGR
jgi:hypothetical protein